MEDDRAARDIGVGPLSEQGTAPSSQRSPSSVSSAVLAAVVVLAGLGALVLAFGGSTNDEAVDDSAVPTLDPVATATAQALPGVVELESTGSSVGPTGNQAIDEAAVREHSVRVGEVFARDIDNEAVQFGIAYATDGELIMLNRNGAVVPELAVAQNFGLVLGLPLFMADGQTWSIDSRRDGLAYLVTSSFIVVQSARTNTLAVYDPSRNEIEPLASGQPAPGIELPDGAEILPVQGRGLLVLPRTGGTFEVDGLASSLRRIDDGMAIAASVQATVFQRCDDQLSCQLVLRRKPASTEPASTEQVVPLDLRVPLAVSPSGDWIVQFGGGTNTVLSTTDGSIIDLDPGEIGGASWASTEQFVALMRTDSIELFFPVEKRSVVLELLAPARTPDLLVYSSAVVS